MKKRFTWMKSATFPCIAGTVCVLAELFVMSFLDTLPGLVLCFFICASAAAALLAANRRFDRCSVFIATTCGVMTVAVLLDFLMDMQAGIENKTFMILAVNWLAPVLICSAARLADRRKKLTGFEEFFRVASVVFFVIYVLSLVALLFFGSANRGHAYSGVNLVPFRTIRLYFTAETLRLNDKILNLAGNVLIFVPLGFYLSVFAYRLPALLRALILLLVPVLIEALQYLFRVGAADVDDVILNFAGGLLGMLLCWGVERLYRRFHRGSEGRFFSFGSRKDKRK